MLDGFETAEVQTGETIIFVRRYGAGPPLLLLHGFPQTHVMWRSVAPLLAQRFTVVCADLRGYGRSGYPGSAPDHAPYAKRAMALDMVIVMERLGFPRFLVAGHDRGGRVAYRWPSDHPERIERIAVLDILPTAGVWDRADARFALASWPWSLLAQPTPLPERLMAAAPETVVDDALGGWGSPKAAFGPNVRAAYVEALRDPARVHAICEDYGLRRPSTASTTTQTAGAGGASPAPSGALRGGRGALNAWYTDAGEPLGLWRTSADDVQGGPLDAGHFFPEERVFA
jgi:haloacetate dehalogenase